MADSVAQGGGFTMDNMVRFVDIQSAALAIQGDWPQPCNFS